jgi:hypothetical protein
MNATANLTLITGGTGKTGRGSPTGSPPFADYVRDTAATGVWNAE